MSIQSAREDFQIWAAAQPVWLRSGEWECDYPHWDVAYKAAQNWIANPDWSDDAVDAFLFLMHHDNESEYIASEISVHMVMATKLAAIAATSKWSDAKWQLADLIEDAGVICRLQEDMSYYTQRRCMMRLARLADSRAKKMVEHAWLTGDEYQRISALWSLHWLNDKDLDNYLAVAQRNPSKWIRKAAQDISQERTA